LRADFVSITWAQAGIARAKLNITQNKIRMAPPILSFPAVYRLREWRASLDLAARTVYLATRRTETTDDP